jgi:biotin carboxyl carrier protein
MEYRYQIGHAIKAVRLERDGDRYRVSIDGAPMREVRVMRVAHGVLELDMGNVKRRAHVACEEQKRYVALGSAVYELQRVERGANRKRHAHADTGTDSLTAVMPGQVIAVNVREGDEVTQGQTLVILEAMKMELRVTASQAGRVQRVFVMQGQVVERGQLLVDVVED